MNTIIQQRRSVFFFLQIPIFIFFIQSCRMLHGTYNTYLPFVQKANAIYKCKKKRRLAEEEQRPTAGRHSAAHPGNQSVRCTAHNLRIVSYFFSNKRRCSQKEHSINNEETNKRIKTKLDTVDYRNTQSGFHRKCCSKTERRNK